MVKTNFKTKELILMALFSALIAIGAFIQIPVPFMDYFTLQFLFVVLSGLLLGAKKGMFSVLVYLLIGLCGFPVFAAGGGIQYVLRPSFGYLIGFAVASYTTGAVCKKLNEKIAVLHFSHYFISCLSGMAVTYIIGFAYKYMILNFYTKTPTGIFTIVAASLPLDIPGDVVLCITASLLAGKLRTILKKELAK